MAVTFSLLCPVVTSISGKCWRLKNRKVHIYITLPRAISSLLNIYNINFSLSKINVYVGMCVLRLSMFVLLFKAFIFYFIYFDYSFFNIQKSIKQIEEKKSTKFTFKNKFIKYYTSQSTKKIKREIFSLKY